jgi:hypothetical protein
MINTMSKARLLISIVDDGGEILAPKGEVFEWDDSSTHQRICGYSLYVDELEVEFID